MRMPASLILCCLVFMVGSLSGDQTTEVKCRIVSDHTDAETVWLGVFVGPANAESEAWNWTSFESEEFTLEVPQTEEDLILVAWRRNSSPITLHLTKEIRSSEITLDFKRGQEVRGTVVSTDGLEVANAVLTIESIGQFPPEAKFEWTSDMAGTFEIGGLEPGDYNIQVALPYVPTESFKIQLTDGADVQKDLELNDAYFVKGQVVDHDGKAVEGAEVDANIDIDFLRFFGHITVASDSSGEFQLGPFRYGQDMTLSARHLEGGSTYRNEVLSGNHKVKLILSRLVSVSGTVLDAESGTFLDEFALSAYGNGWMREYQHVEANGEISARVDSEIWALVIDAPKYHPFFKTPITLDSLDEYDLGIVKLEHGKEVSGIVYDSTSRQPIEGATIESLGPGQDGRLPPVTGRSTFILRYMQHLASTTSDSQGKYALDSLPTTESLLWVRAQGYRSEEIAVVPQVKELDIGLTPRRDVRSTRIVGRVETTGGEPVVGQIDIYHVENNSGIGFRSKDDGSFERFTRGGIHRIYATSDLGRSETHEISIKEGSVEEVVLVVNPFGRLVVTISGLKGVESAFIEVFEGLREISSTGGVSNGESVLTGLGTGSFSVRAWTTMNRTIEKQFSLTKEAAEAHVGLSLDGDSRLYGRISALVGRDAYRQVRAIGKETGSLSGWSDILDDGSFEILGLSDGEYWVEVGEESTPARWERDKAGRKSRFEAIISGDTELNFEFAAP